MKTIKDMLELAQFLPQPLIILIITVQLKHNIPLLFQLIVVDHLVALLEL